MLYALLDMAHIVHSVSIDWCKLDLVLSDSGPSQVSAPHLLEFQQHVGKFVTV